MTITRILPELPLNDHVEISSQAFPMNALPRHLVADRSLGIVRVAPLDGSVVHRADLGLFEVRGLITPMGDYLIMFPAGFHYAHSDKLSNQMLSYRSPDHGKTWIGPSSAFTIDYNQHGFIPLIPSGSNRIYCFGTQPVWQEYKSAEGQFENARIGYFFSDDDGNSWTGPSLIRPENDSGFKGMSVTRMCESDRGSWILGAHEADWSSTPLRTRQYVLRSADRGASWNVFPEARPNGWYLNGFQRMDEGRCINIGNGGVLLMTRTPEGHLWSSKSLDDGFTWSKFKPTPLVHPDAPPMIEYLPDGKTLLCLHHNRHHDLEYTGLSGDKEPLMKDRSEVWVSLSTDHGDTWSEPRFLFCNALKPDLGSPFRNHQCSYLDIMIDGQIINIFVPHRWQQILHLKINASDLERLPTRKELVGER